MALCSISNSTHKLPTILVLSSGGVKGILQLGCLHHLYLENKLVNITKYIGTSIGSVINLLLLVGYTPIEISGFMCCNKLDVTTRTNTLHDFTHDFGFKSPEIFFDSLETLIQDKISYSPSLKELWDSTGCDFVCCTYNLTCNKTEYLNYLNYPNLSCIDAVKMSSNIPILFPKIIYNNCFYVDGAIFDAFPINYAQQHQTQTDVILGIVVISTLTNVDTNSNIIEYIQSLARLMLHKNHIYPTYDNINIIELTSHGIDDSMLLNISSDKIYECFTLGYNTYKAANLRKSNIKIKQS